MDKEEMTELLNWFQETQLDKHPTGQSSNILTVCEHH